jgi:hypothetical protein
VGGAAHREGRASKLAEIDRLDARARKQAASASKCKSVSLDDLMVVAEFRDTIYPGLKYTGRVARGGDKPCHTVINGENYHVLKALTWTHRGKVDAIYIDPPYNTGAKDWKYNNDYVEGDDLYRHSKWLAMMERRLKMAKEFLNPGGFGADRHHRREGIPAPRPVAGADVSGGADSDDQQPDQSGCCRQGKWIRSRRRVPFLRDVRLCWPATCLAGSRMGFGERPNAYWQDSVGPSSSFRNKHGKKSLPGMLLSNLR